jgi:hypothetical protein
LQGFAPKLAKGEIASLSGAGDDPRYFQIRFHFFIPPLFHGGFVAIDFFLDPSFDPC